MYQVYLNIERRFEILTLYVTKVLGNSITFILVFCLVIYWWASNLFTSKDVHQNIGDIIFGTTFLSLFVIQKSFNRYSASIHLKMNELISSNKQANNSVMDIYKKTEQEIRDLSMEYIGIDDIVEKEIDLALKEINTENQI
jgi:low affinity Fe/Cu permease